MKCPICENESKNKICLVCGYDIQNDITINHLLNKLSNEEISDYKNRIKIHKDIYNQAKNNNIKQHFINNEVNEQCIQANQYYLEKDYTQALLLYQNEARKGNTYAMKRLADMYFKGEGKPYNVNLGLELYHQAIELDDSKALYELGRKYEDGYGHLKQSHVKARNLYEKDVEVNKNIDSYVKLADFYHYGKGGIKDLNKAKRYYEEAIRLGNTYAMRRLADMYFLGNGCIPNINKGIKLYNKAINLNDKEALLELSERYKTGYGKLKKDNIKVQELRNQYNQKDG